MKPAPKAALAQQGRSVPPDWAVVFVRKSTGRGVDSLVVEALARRVAGLVGVFEELADASLDRRIRAAVEQVKKL